MISFRPSPQFDKSATFIFLTKEDLNNKRLANVPSDIKSEVEQAVKNDYFQGKSGQIYSIPYKKTIVCLAGLGDEEELTPRSLRTNVRKALLDGLTQDKKNVEVVPHKSNESVVKGYIEAVEIGLYSWDKYKSQKDPSNKKHVFLTVNKKQTYEDTVTICQGTNLTRDLVNENADVATSSYLEKQIKDILKGQKNIKVHVLNEKELKAKKLGLHLAVNQGSVNEPKLIIVEYNGDKRSKTYTALVGKGITFDTGGLNLKPTGSIETMRMDMGGAGAVIGVLKNTVSLGLKKNVLFAVGIAENVTGSKSYKPGDVITGYAGKSVEIGNTDAEGRLVLADAIAYVTKNYNIKRLIDIATLTGAVVVALGNDHTGLVSNDPKMTQQLLKTSIDTDDRVWQLPSYPELRQAVKSKIADIRNIGFPRGAAGTLTAAEFLRQFTNDVNWAHLDIAGTASVDSDSRDYFGHGGTGSAVRLLTNFLKSY